MINLAVFASGSGSNAENLVLYFDKHPKIRVSLILSNKLDAFVLQRAKQLNIPTVVFNKDDFYHSDNVLKALADYRIDRLVLAGFLWLIPDNLLKAFPQCIINIHPALLPRYGGRGMYGNHVHEAVIANDEKETGITIHLVDAEYDHGKILFQIKCPVLPNDTPKTVAAKVHVLEHQYFPIVVEQWAVTGNL
ncbi:MAG: phosphoribosylglycinamide formyltransferase [Prevotellaceae bacterium]|jgi:phosphoribosylglycinamide formyltransferase-1|nr:phosphoribosylglycinamide formyltransferase [Prevotellaceae bacterium]